MTTVCASRMHGEMAADTRANLDYNFTHFPSKKITGIGDLVIGCAGRAIDCSAFQKWMREGADPEKRPALGSEDTGFQSLVLTHDGLYYYESDCTPLKIERDYHAIGTGAQAAIAALMCGKTPKRAVEVACKIDSNSGLPVDVIRL